MFPGTILMGAQSRLLPPSIPFRFFFAATFFHIVFWALVLISADQVPGFVGGTGPVLAALHTLTLGVFTMTAMGASFQLLTVATGVALRAVWPCHLAWWLYFPGVIVLLVGFATHYHYAQALGAVAAIGGLVVYGVVVADVLRRTKSLKMAITHAWFALIALAALMILGFMLIADFDHGFLNNHAAIGLAHFILAVFGFMGLLAFGFSTILVPMFALSPAVPDRQGWMALASVVPAIILAVLGVVLGQKPLIYGGFALGLIGTGFHLWCMWFALKKGMRKRLGLSFVMIKGAWVMLPVTLLLGAAATAGWLGYSGITLFGFVSVAGWLLTFLLGILQRIIPFLASMNMNRKGRKPPTLSEMADDRTLKAAAVCHVLAVLSVAVGIVQDQGNFVFAGALCGTLGAVAFLWYASAVGTTYLSYHQGGGAETLETTDQ